ncbi:hypothetical protein [Aeromonas allosaccharophila]|uniref:Uncharacterized protein n=1 Tax=Aeromonas allosaccharophila TaxID=656 RepID=A0AAX3NV21_9GAMM|nr:hypothetical protein [Aeromonas allosaccharophila]WED77559.1 hypothetical protein PYU98_04720 [Aeromonas allosaccharophila]
MIKPTRSVPKNILLMDICTIGIIKNREKILRGKDSRKKTRLQELEIMAQSNKYRFSFLLAIIEKTTDRRHILTESTAIKEFENDWRAIKGVIGKENMHEPLESFKLLIPTMMDARYHIDERAELSMGPAIELLDYYNELGIHSTPEQIERISLTRKIVDFSKKIGFKQSHLVVIICVSALHGCRDAQKILKIKKDGSEFNPSNILGDIMSFVRTAHARALIKSKLPSARCIFRTEDKALESIGQYFNVTYDINTSAVTTNFHSLQNLEKLFPTLFSKNSTDSIRNEVFSLLQINIPKEGTS